MIIPFLQLKIEVSKGVFEVMDMFFSIFQYGSH